METQFNDSHFSICCRSIVQRYTAEWEKTVTRLGRWIDFKNDYKTMDPEYMESVWFVLTKMFATAHLDRTHTLFLKLVI